MALLADEPSRHVDLSGCFNFRDLGGYPASDGRRTRWRRLFRADGLGRLSAADLAVLEGLAVVTVVDLRTPLEADGRGRYPDGAAGARYHHLPLTDVLPGEEEAPEWENPMFVAGRYLAMVDEGGPSVAAALRLLADPVQLPAVFHCSVGKDRTGVLAAVILGLLGVADDDIVADYVLSREAMTRLLAALRAEFPDAGPIVDRFEPVILSVSPASMVGFLDALRYRYGSFTGLADALEVGDVVADLQGALLESPR